MILLKYLIIGMFLLGIVWLIVDNNREIWKNAVVRLENCKERNVYIFLFFFIVLSQMVFVVFRKLPFIADEVYSLSGAAFFAGYDWSSYMSQHKFYNFGYTMLMAPLYKMFKNPVTIYRAMLFVNVLVFAVMFLIIYRIAEKHLKLKRHVAIAMAFACTFNSIVMFFKGFVYNELPLAFIMWLVLLLLLEIVDSAKGKRILLSALAGGVAAYGYLIHSRCIILFGALAFLIVLYLIVYKKWIVQPVACAGAFAICIYLERRIFNYVQANLYLKGLDSVMSNSVQQVVTSTSRYEILKSFDGIIRITKQFFSLSGAVSIETGGMLTIITVIFVCYLINNLKKMLSGKEKKKIFILIVFSTIAFWGIIACISLIGANNGYDRFLIYTRYFTPFVGPFLLTGLYLLKTYKKIQFKWVAIGTAIISLIVILVYIFYTFPQLDGHSMTGNGTMYLFIPFARYGGQMKFSKNVFGIALGLLVIFTMILLFLYRRKQFIAFSMVVTLFCFLLVVRVEQRQCKGAAERKYKASNATYTLLEQEDGFEDRDVYCVGGETYRKTVLISSYDKDIVFDLRNMQTGENAVLLSNKVDSLKTYEVPFIFQLDKNEWIGVWDPELKAALEQKYQLQ